MYGENETAGIYTSGNSITGSALRMPDVGSKQGEIGMECDALHKCSEELRLCIGELEQRLTPILAPEKPMADSGMKTAPELVRTPLAETIHQRTQDVLSFTSRLRYLLGRVEL